MGTSVQAPTEPVLWERARDQLRRWIIDGALSAGTPLPEQELARRLGMSRNPVREALRALQREGWVVSQRRLGVRVRDADPAEGADVLEVRALLDVAVSGRAAGRRHTEELPALELLLSRGTKATANGAIEELVELNHEFHHLVAGMARSPMLAELLDHLDVRVRWYFAQVAHARSTNSWREHSEIARAIMDGDASAAVAVARRHTAETVLAYRHRTGLDRQSMADGYARQPDAENSFGLHCREGDRRDVMVKEAQRGEVDGNGLRRLHQDDPLWMRVYRELERGIMARRLAPGSALVEEAIAKQLGVSRIPVREALRMLERDGWVVTRPRAGATVRDVSPAEASELFEVRGLLEAHAAGRAAQRATARESESLRRLIVDEQRAYDEGDRNSIVALNDQFHDEIARMSGNSTLRELTLRVAKQVAWLVASFAGTARAPRLNDHRILVDALEAGDAERAMALARSHVDAARQAYVDRLGNA